MAIVTASFTSFPQVLWNDKIKSVRTKPSGKQDNVPWRNQKFWGTTKKKKFKKQTRSDAQRKEIVKKQNKTKHSSNEIR